MKRISFQLLLISLSFNIVLCQTETFEDEVANATSFTTSGLLMNTSGDFIIEVTAGFGCASDSWLGSGTNNGGSTGSFGGFQVAVPGEKFTLSTSSAFCAWSSNNDGFNFASGDVQFVGTLASGGTISETININPPSSFEYDMITFSNAVWGNQELTALAVNIVSGINYIAIDNIVFADITLPIELNNFEGNYLGDNIMLSWQTVSEINNEKFEIEESQDGILFRKYDDINGMGTSSALSKYSFIVKNPRSELLYYRLKQIDYDGKHQYSKIISVNSKMKSKTIGEFFPNPSESGVVDINYFSNNVSNVFISVFDIRNKLVYSQIKHVLDGTNRLSFNFSNLNSGIYIVKIGNEKISSCRKLIIEN